MDNFLYLNKEVYVHYTDILPSHVNGLVKEKNGAYFILIKNSLSDSKKLKTLMHEMWHIKSNDLNKANSVYEIENEVGKE